MEWKQVFQDKSNGLGGDCSVSSLMNDDPGCFHGTILRKKYHFTKSRKCGFFKNEDNSRLLYQVTILQIFLIPLVILHHRIA
jgi:hypothetical protein